MPSLPPMQRTQLEQQLWLFYLLTSYVQFYGTACPLLRHLSGRVCPHQSWEFCAQLREARAQALPVPPISSTAPHQSRNSFREPIRDRLERRISNLESRHFWQTNTSGTLDLRIFAQDR